MNIIVNEEPLQIDGPQSLNSLVEGLISDTRGMAIAINNSVIPRQLWKSKVLEENDKVLLIKATQGG